MVQLGSVKLVQSGIPENTGSLIPVSEDCVIMSWKGTPHMSHSVDAVEEDVVPES